MARAIRAVARSAPRGATLVGGRPQTEPPRHFLDINQYETASLRAVLDVMLAPGFFDKVNANAKYLWGKLETLAAKYPKLFERVRGAGMLVGVKCVVTAGDVVAKAREKGLLVLTAGDNVLRILPPLTVTEREIDEAVGILDKVASEWPAQ